MKLEKLQETAGMLVAYAPYCPAAASVKDRGFKAFLQVSAWWGGMLYADMKSMCSQINWCLLFGLIFLE